MKKGAHLDKLITTRGNLKEHFDFSKFSLISRKLGALLNMFSTPSNRNDSCVEYINPLIGLLFLNLAKLGFKKSCGRYRRVILRQQKQHGSAAFGVDGGLCGTHAALQENFAHRTFKLEDVPSRIVQTIR